MTVRARLAQLDRTIGTAIVDIPPSYLAGLRLHGLKRVRVAIQPPIGSHLAKGTQCLN